MGGEGLKAGFHYDTSRSRNHLWWCNFVWKPCELWWTKWGRTKPCERWWILRERARPWERHECGPDSVNQPNALSTSTGPYLNADILEEIIRQTLSSYPHMRPTLRAVSRFFRTVVDREPLPLEYIPELNDFTNIYYILYKISRFWLVNFTNIYRVSVRKIMRLKGKRSGAVIRNN